MKPATIRAARVVVKGWAARPDNRTPIACSYSVSSVARGRVRLHLEAEPEPTRPSEVSPRPRRMMLEFTAAVLAKLVLGAQLTAQDLALEVVDVDAGEISVPEQAKVDAGDRQLPLFDNDTPAGIAAAAARRAFGGAR